MHAARWKTLGAAVVVLALAAACSGKSDASRPQPSATTTPPTYRLDRTLRIDDMQVLGSHNSYHLRPDRRTLAAITDLKGASAQGLDYGHRGLAEQLDLGVRQLELDVWADPAGGKYARPALAVTLGRPLPEPAVMRRPGFKVMHEADIDTGSTCLTFVRCLRQVKVWSDAHPGHVPVMVDVEMKDKVVTPPTFDALDAEIRSVFEPGDLLTPDDVRGTDAGLGHAVRTRGWPTLGASRGRVMFMLDNELLAPIELRGHPSLRGRILFAPSAPGTGYAAVAKLNDPVAQAPLIKAALAANMLVRTRADADTLQARANDTTTREAALAGGAQFVSTDYEVPDRRFSEYVVRMAGGRPARCDPVTAPPVCRPRDIEDPDLLTVPPPR